MTGQPTYVRLTGQKGDDGVPGKDGNSWRMRGRAEAWYKTKTAFEADTRDWENGQVVLIDQYGDDVHVAFMLQGKTVLSRGVWTGTNSEAGDAYTIGKHIYMAMDDRWLDVGEFAGEQGPQGDPGTNGRTVRIYKALVEGRTYYSGDTVTADGFCYLDYYAERNDAAETGWLLYACKKTYTHNKDSQRDDHWKQVAVNANDAFFQTLIAKNARIDFMTGANIAVLDNDGRQYAGLGGDFPLWVGERYNYPSVTGDNYSAYTFTVSKAGALYSKNAYIEGHVTATSGKIAGFYINGSTLSGESGTSHSKVTLSPGSLSLKTVNDIYYSNRKFLVDSESNIVAAIGYETGAGANQYGAALQLSAKGGAGVALDILEGITRGLSLETATVTGHCTMMDSNEATGSVGTVTGGSLRVRSGAVVMVGHSNNTDTNITLPKNIKNGNCYLFVGLDGSAYHLLPAVSGQTIRSINDGKGWADVKVAARSVAFVVGLGGVWYCRIFY